MATQEALLSPRAYLTGTFFQAMQAAFQQSILAELTTLVPSNQEIETYRWLNEAPGLEEFTGPRPIEGLSSGAYTLANKVFTAGLRVKREDLRRDTSGQIAIRMGELGARAAQHPEELLATRMMENGNAYDGNAFFGDTHTEPTFDNNVAADISTYPVLNVGTITAPSMEEAGYAMHEGINALLGATDVRGKLANPSATNFGVMVPLALATPFSLAANAATADQGGPNVMHSRPGLSISVQVNPRLTAAGWGASSFMVWDKGAAVKPFLYQLEEPVRLDFLGAGTTEEIMNRASVALVEYSGNIGYARFTSAVKVTLT